MHNSRRSVHRVDYLKKMIGSIFLSSSLQLTLLYISQLPLVNGLRGELHIFTEVTPRELTCELRGQLKKKRAKDKFKTNKHLRQPHKNYLQKGIGVLNSLSFITKAVTQRLA